MQNKFRDHIAQHFPFLMEQPFFVAVSGGIDSMVLVHLCQSLKLTFTILHCNFGLRGKESDSDTDFLRHYAEKNSVPLLTAHFDTKKFAQENKLSTQMAARELRYNWFAEQLTEKKTGYIATAHHADDSLETFIINLSRGTGLDGLLGIPAINAGVIRPLLIFSRAEIEAYAAANDVEWREDSSNASDDYLRNKIRHYLIPALKDTNTAFLDAFQNTVAHLQQSKSLADDAASIVFSQVCEQTINGDYHFDIAQLMRLPNRNAYLFHWLSGFGFTAWEDIYNLLSAQSGKQVFSPRYVLLKDREHLILSVMKEKRDEYFFISKEGPQVNFPLKFSFCNVTDISKADSNCIFVDEDLLHFPLLLRKWEEADYFFPFGMKGKKKLSKYFKDEKISLIDKSNIWLLCSDNQIVWIVGKRQDERFKVTKNTTKILQITART